MPDDRRQVDRRSAWRGVPRVASRAVRRRGGARRCSGPASSGRAAGRAPARTPASPRPGRGTVGDDPRVADLGRQRGGDGGLSGEPVVVAAVDPHHVGGREPHLVGDAARSFQTGPWGRARRPAARCEPGALRARSPVSPFVIVLPFPPSQGRDRDEPTARSSDERPAAPERGPGHRRAQSPNGLVGERDAGDTRVRVDPEEGAASARSGRRCRGTRRLASSAGTCGRAARTRGPTGSGRLLAEAGQHAGELGQLRAWWPRQGLAARGRCRARAAHRRSGAGRAGCCCDRWPRATRATTVAVIPSGTNTASST